MQGLPCNNSDLGGMNSRRYQKNSLCNRGGHLALPGSTLYLKREERCEFLGSQFPGGQIFLLFGGKAVDFHAQRL